MTAPLTKNSTAADNNELSQEVSVYLDALAGGLSNDFPNEEFDHLKLLGRLGVVSRLYERVVKQYLNQFSLMPVELQVLVTLKADVASAPAELASATQQTRAGMTSTLDRLEKRKIIKRVPHPTDRRKTMVQLSKSGDNLACKLVKVQNDALNSLMQNVPKKELNVITGSLDKLINLMAVN